MLDSLTLGGDKQLENKLYIMNYLVPDPEPIVIGEPCWLDTYKCCYILNTSHTKKILKIFVLITNGLAIIGGI